MGLYVRQVEPGGQELAWESWRLEECSHGTLLRGDQASAVDSIPGAKSSTDDDAQATSSHEWPDVDLEILQEAFLDGKPQPNEGGDLLGACLKQMSEAQAKQGQVQG